jgi:hypothetical protein
MSEEVEMLGSATVWVPVTSLASDVVVIDPITGHPRMARAIRAKTGGNLFLRMAGRRRYVYSPGHPKSGGGTLNQTEADALNAQEGYVNAAAMDIKDGESRAVFFDVIKSSGAGTTATGLEYAI